MNDANPKTNEAVEPFFSAVLTPHRSLGPNGLLALMVCIGGVSFVTGLMFVAMGAWPVFGFFGLDVALVWFAFRRNYRDARAFEEVHVSAQEVILTKVASSGKAQVYRFNPAWLRLEVERIEDEGVIRLRLRSHGTQVPVGDFLNPGDREDFTSAFGAALASARTGGPARSMT